MGVDEKISVADLHDERSVLSKMLNNQLVFTLTSILMEGNLHSLQQ